MRAIAHTRSAPREYQRERRPPRRRPAPPAAARLDLLERLDRLAGGERRRRQGADVWERLLVGRRWQRLWRPLLGRRARLPRRLPLVARRRPLGHHDPRVIRQLLHLCWPRRLQRGGHVGWSYSNAFGVTGLRRETKRNYAQRVEAPGGAASWALVSEPGCSSPSIRTYLSVSLHHLRLHGRAAVGRPEPTEHENTGTDRSAGAWGASATSLSLSLSFMYGHAASNQQGPTPLPAARVLFSCLAALCISRPREKAARRGPKSRTRKNWLSNGGQFSCYVRSPTSSRRARCALRGPP